MGNPARKLEDYVSAQVATDRSKDLSYQKILTKSLTKLKDRMPPYWENTKQGLVALLPYAAQKGVQAWF